MKSASDDGGTGAVNASVRDLDPFFAPKAVAVVGASPRESSVGYAVLRNLLFGSVHGGVGPEARARGFAGPVFAVNPKGGEILGQRVYATLSEVPSPIDLMVVAIPPRFIPDLIEEGARKGITNVIVISAGFAEMGEEGLALQRDMLERAKANQVRIIGPNCLGVIRPGSALNASFAESAPPPGRIGLLSQSGALITGLISYAQREQFGLSAAISLGAKADVEDEDVLRWLGADAETHAIALYVEAFPSPRRFFEVARALSATKPVIALKGGATAAGAKAASSHTGSLAGSMAAYSAAFSQAGVLQAHRIADFMNWSRALAFMPPAAGPRLAIVTNAGGPGVLCADAAIREGIEMAELSEATLAQLDRVLPAVWSHNNPVDIIGDATPERYRDALTVLGKAPEVDVIVLLMTVQSMTDPAATARAIAEAHRDPSWTKPILCSFLGLVGTETGSYLDAHGIPEFDIPEDAVSAAAALVRRGRWLRRKEPPAAALANTPQPNLVRAREIVNEARAAGQTNLDLGRAREVLACAGLRYNGSETVADDDSAVAAARRIGFPVVVKVVSPDVLHKSDVGGVVLNVIDDDGVRAACSGIRARVAERQPGARVEGFTIEEQVSGTEIIVGMSRDPGFGALMMVGMGGIFVEVYKDVTFRLLPLTRRDALDMLEEIRAQPLLDGARGRPTLDRAELAEIILRVSTLVDAIPEVAEIDLNPLVITTEGLVAIDARVIVDPLAP